MGRMPWWGTPKGHGTEARARRHRRNGEKPCQGCLEAEREARRLRGRRKPEKLLARGIKLAYHGNVLAKTILA